MSEYGVYEVTGRRPYRGHKPGTTFEARLDPAVEDRAVRRRDIRLIRRVTPSLVRGSYRLPRGWPPPAPNDSPVVNRGAERRLSHVQKEG